MREVNVELIRDAVRKLSIEANYFLGSDIKEALQKSREEETWKLAADVLDKIIINSEIANNEKMPMCQDTGMACVFIEIGQDVHLVGGRIEDAVNEGVRRGYEEGFLRKSVVDDPIRRINTKDNTPAVIYYDIVDGDKVKITLAPKGFGSENCSAVRMLKPSDGVEGVRRFIIETVTKAAPNACLPMVVGIGIGGTMDYSAYLAKKACLRPIGEWSSDIRYADFEKELLQMINSMDFGPMGLGGDTSALHVAIEHFPTHIAALPVSINIICHMVRHKKGILV